MIKERVKSQSGFSLVELMIVVAIIGILATVAIPNFSRFQAKARQSEAKTNLAALFSSEKAFFAEWTQYYTDFRDIGVAPEGQLRYHMGFTAAGVAPLPPFIGSTNGGGVGTAFNTTIAWARAPGSTLHASIPGYAAAAVNGTCGASALNAGSGSTATFRANSIGNPGSTAVLDVWSIGQAKDLCNNQSGI